MQRAVQKTGYADFWELYKRNNLPGETKNYVPEILAAIIIANHPTQYGFDEITLDPPVLTDTVTINYSADLRLVSDIVGAPVDELIALNPSLLRMATPPDTEFDLHLPAGTAALFQEKIAAIPVSKRNSWRYHKVTPDDTLASVAHTYSVSVSALADANQLDSRFKARGRRSAGRARSLPARRPRRTPSTTPPVAATPWSPLPTASASLSLSSAAGTSSRPPAFGSNLAAGCTSPSLPSSRAAPAAAGMGKQATPAKSPAAPERESSSSRAKTSSSHSCHASRTAKPLVKELAQRGFDEALHALQIFDARTKIIMRTNFWQRVLIVFRAMCC